jgi:hypothetical protein
VKVNNILRERNTNIKFNKIEVVSNSKALRLMEGKHVDKTLNIKLRILNKIRYMWPSEFLKGQ